MYKPNVDKFTVLVNTTVAQFNKYTKIKKGEFYYDRGTRIRFINDEIFVDLSFISTDGQTEYNIDTLNKV